MRFYLLRNKIIWYINREVKGKSCNAKILLSRTMRFIHFQLSARVKRSLTIRRGVWELSFLHYILMLHAWLVGKNLHV